MSYAGKILDALTKERKQKMKITDAVEKALGEEYVTEEISQRIIKEAKGQAARSPAAEKVEGVVREALERRGWSPGESQQIIERLKLPEATDIEMVQTIERVIERTKTQTVKSHDLEK